MVRALLVSEDLKDRLEILVFLAHLELSDHPDHRDLLATLVRYDRHDLFAMCSSCMQM